MCSDPPERAFYPANVGGGGRFHVGLVRPRHAVIPTGNEAGALFKLTVPGGSHEVRASDGAVSPVGLP